MERVRDVAPPEPTVPEDGGREQVRAIVERLVAACDYYAARCIQESGLRDRQSDELDQTRRQLDSAQEELKAARDEVEKLRVLLARQEEAHAQEDARAQEEARARQEELDALASRSFQLLALGDELAQALEHTKRQCARQRVQIDCLNAQVARYQRLIERLKGAWYGKILIRIYHIFQKLGWI